jgi:CRP/FNR family transcriptional regulator, cyclic AMP receptor protein
MVGEVRVADSLGPSADVLTLQEITFLWIDQRTFRLSAAESPVFAQNLAKILSRRLLRLTNIHLRSVAALDVPGRVASRLLALAHGYGRKCPKTVRIPIRLTQSALAGLWRAPRGYGSIRP